MNRPNGKRPVAVVTACTRADGCPDFTFTEVEVTQQEYDNGVHYDLAAQSLAERGYEKPYVHFDDREAPPFLHKAVREYLGIGASDNGC